MDFDVRILHPAAFGLVAAEFDERIKIIAGSILGDTTGGSFCKSLRVLAHHGGRGLVADSITSTCCYLMGLGKVAVGVGQRIVAESHYRAVFAAS